MVSNPCHFLCTDAWFCFTLCVSSSYPFVIYVPFIYHIFTVIFFPCLQSLAEKGGSVLEKITSHPEFFVLATMNPGGDYGKKELSPALRNRFTEIWVPPVGDPNELKSIALQRYVKFEAHVYGR